MAKAVVTRTSKEYLDSRDVSPFNQWLTGLRDARTQVKITKAITKMENGNFGACKPITSVDGLYEACIDYGPGYRIYYTLEGSTVILIYAGSDKGDQQRTVEQVEIYIADYKKRKPKEAADLTHGRGSVPKKRKKNPK